jgi:hypothetical protein
MTLDDDQIGVDIFLEEDRLTKSLIDLILLTRRESLSRGAFSIF